MATPFGGRNGKMSQNLVAAIRDIVRGGFHLSQGDASDTKFATLNQSRCLRARMPVLVSPRGMGPVMGDGKARLCGILTRPHTRSRSVILTHGKVSVLRTVSPSVL